MQHFAVLADDKGTALRKRDKGRFYVEEADDPAVGIGDQRKGRTAVSLELALGFVVVGGDRQEMRSLKLAIPDPVGTQLERSAAGKGLWKKRQDDGARPEQLIKLVVLTLRVGGTEIGNNITDLRGAGEDQGKRCRSHNGAVARRFSIVSAGLLPYKRPRFRARQSPQTRM